MKLKDIVYKLLGSPCQKWAVELYTMTPTLCFFRYGINWSEGKCYPVFSRSFDNKEGALKWRNDTIETDKQVKRNKLKAEIRYRKELEAEVEAEMRAAFNNRQSTCNNP